MACFVTCKENLKSANDRNLAGSRASPHAVLYCRATPR